MDRELNEKELENVLDGANPEVVKKKVKENKKLYRQDEDMFDRRMTFDELQRILDDSNKEEVDNEMCNNEERDRTR